MLHLIQTVHRIEHCALEIDGVDFALLRDGPVRVGDDIVGRHFERNGVVAQSFGRRVGNDIELAEKVANQLVQRSVEWSEQENSFSGKSFERRRRRSQRRRDRNLERRGKCSKQSGIQNFARRAGKYQAVELLLVGEFDCSADDQVLFALDIVQNALV